MTTLQTTPNDTVFVTLSFTDDNGVPMTPSTLSYSVTDRASQTIIIPSTPVTPSGTSQIITIAPANNQLVGRVFETHVLLAIATDAFGNQKDSVCWDVRSAALACGCT